MRTRNAPRLLSARSLDLIASSRSGLRVSFLAFLALGFELCELLRSQDCFCLLPVFGLARFGATRLLMLGHGRIHLCLLISRQVQARQRNLTRRLGMVPDLFCAVAMFTRKHRPSRKQSRRY